MKKLLLLSLLFSNFAFADSDDYKKADKQLNLNYQIALLSIKKLSQNSDDEKYLTDKLKTSQRQWLKQLELDCSLNLSIFAYKADVIDGGHNSFIYDEVKENCKTDLIKQRADFLNGVNLQNSGLQGD